MHAHILELRQEMQNMEEIRIQSEAVLAQSVTESKNFVVQKLESGLVGLSHRVYAMIEDINQKIPDPPAPGGGGEGRSRDVDRAFGKKYARH